MTREKDENKSWTFKDVYELLLKESQVPTLMYIPQDTYQEIALTVARLRGYVLEGIEAKIRDRMTELISKSAQLLLELRYQKLMEEQDRESLQSSISSEVSTLDYSKLTDEEKYIIDSTLDFKKRKSTILTATISGRQKILESISSNIRSKQVVVRFMKPMDQFIGIDMTKYGPFEQEDVAILPFENARSLIDSGKVTEINLI